MESATNILKYLLKHKDSNDIIYTMFSNIDINKAFIDASNNVPVAYQPTFEQIKENHLDGDSSYVIFLSNTDHSIVAILGEGDMQENGDDLWTNTEILFNTTDKESVGRLLQYCKSRCYAYCIQLRHTSKRIKHHSYGRPIRDNYEFDQRKEKRQYRVLHNKLFKMVIDSHEHFDSDIDDMQQIKQYVDKLYTNMYDRLLNAKLIYPMLEPIDIRVTDFEFDLRRNCLYMDNKCPYKYIDKDGKLQFEKYASTYISVKAFAFKDGLELTDKQKKRYILQRQSYKVCLSFISACNRLFIDRNMAMEASNISTNGFKIELLGKLYDAYANNNFVKQIIY